MKSDKSWQKQRRKGCSTDNRDSKYFSLDKLLLKLIHRFSENQYLMFRIIYLLYIFTALSDPIRFVMRCGKFWQYWQFLEDREGPEHSLQHFRERVGVGFRRQRRRCGGVRRRFRRRTTKQVVPEAALFTSGPGNRVVEESGDEAADEHFDVEEHVEDVVEFKVASVEGMFLEVEGDDEAEKQGKAHYGQVAA